jgi:hypothetical protein
MHDTGSARDAEAPFGQLRAQTGERRTLRRTADVSVNGGGARDARYPPGMGEKKVLHGLSGSNPEKGKR